MCLCSTVCVQRCFCVRAQTCLCVFFGACACAYPCSKCVCEVKTVCCFGSVPRTCLGRALARCGSSVLFSHHRFSLKNFKCCLTMCFPPAVCVSTACSTTGVSSTTWTVTNMSKSFTWTTASSVASIDPVAVITAVRSRDTFDCLHFFK